MSAGKIKKWFRDHVSDFSCLNFLIKQEKKELFLITYPVKHIGSSCETESGIFHMGQN